MPFQGLGYWQLNQHLQDSPAPAMPDDATFSDELCDFVRRCLIKDGTKRPSAAQLLRHPWIANAADDPAQLQAHYKKWLKWCNSKIVNKRAKSAEESESVEDMLEKAFPL
mmetsp:Transcript_60400/g.99934  ORF Transcript_60400/g.99934 Transcript_60400/m.99934 type:complete len:110 (-) Transcript_60400:19-348(-)